MQTRQPAIMLVLASLTLSGQAAMQEHAHHATTKTPAVCAGVDVLPSLTCGLAPSARFDRKGRLWLAWAYAGHVYVNFSDDKGKRYSPPVVVNKTPEPIAARGENRPKLAIDKQGHVLVSWTMKLPQRYSGYVRFSHSSDGGQNFTVPITVNDNLALTSHRFESLAVNDQGMIYLVWLDKRDRLAAEAKGQAYIGAAVYFAVSSDGGNTFQRNKKIIDHSCECCRTAMAIDKDGLPVMLWRQVFGKNTRDHALVKLISTAQAGEVRRASFDNWQVDACPHHGPALSIGGDGVYHLVWFDNAPARHGLFYAQSTDQGRSFVHTMHFGNYQANASHPQVLSLGHKVYLLWQEFDGKQSSLVSMQSGDNGKTWSRPVVRLQTTRDTDYPFLLHDGDQVYAAWHRRGKAYRLIPLL